MRRVSAASPRIALPGVEHDLQAHRHNVRLAVAASEYPRTLILASGMLLLFTIIPFVINALADPPDHTWGIYIDFLVMAAVMLVVGLLLRGPTVPPEAKPWVLAATGILMGLGLYINAVLDPNPFSYAIIYLLLCVCGAATLSWWPFLAQAGAITVGGLVVLLIWYEDSAFEGFMLTLGAAIVGAILLNVRLRTIDELADATAETQRIAITDQLTGAFNRHGLMEHVTPLWSMAERLDQNVFVIFIDIRGLKRANDLFGHEFGDRVIRDATAAVLTTVRRGDLVGRWGGDEIVVLGIGEAPDAEAFTSRLTGRAVWPVDITARWDGDLTVGFAVGSPRSDTIDDLISRADGDMYRRREAQ